MKTFNGYTKTNIKFGSLFTDQLKFIEKDYIHKVDDNGFMHVRRIVRPVKIQPSTLQPKVAKKPLKLKSWVIKAYLLLVLSMIMYALGTYMKPLNGRVINPVIGIKIVSAHESVVVRQMTIEQKIRSVFGENGDWAVKCFKSESWSRKLNDYDPNATHVNTNGTTDRGVAQVNSIHCGKVKGDCENLYDVDENLRVAKIVYDTQGKGAWYGSSCN